MGIFVRSASQRFARATARSRIIEATRTTIAWNGRLGPRTNPAVRFFTRRMSSECVPADRVQEASAPVSGFLGRACLSGMHVAYLMITILAALANSYAASLNFVGAESVKVVADRLHVSRKWMLPFGTLLASGAIGLLVGFAVPVLGKAAAIGLVVYFICAISAHIRAGDSGVGGAVFFLLLAAGALVTTFGYHNRW
jgi:hypothetical protein